MAKVLLADDSVTIHKVVEIVLTAKGFTLKAVSDGDKALEAVKSFEPDVVLADIEMPGLSGYDLARAMKDDPATRDIPVILLAGAFESIDEARAQASGASDTLVKPFEAEDLVGKIRRLLSPEAASRLSEPPQPEESGEVLEVEGLEALGPESEEEFLDFGDLVGEEEEPAPEGFEPFEEPHAEKAGEELKPLEEEEEPFAGAFAEELTKVEAGPEEAESRGSSVEAPGSREAFEAFVKVLDERISEAVDAMDLRAALMEAIAPNLAEAVEKVLWEIVPELTEKLARETLAESMRDLKKELEQVIWETVPEIAEKIISKEIERIREES